MLSARLTVMLMGRPSGTATTISVTAIITEFRANDMKPTHEKSSPKPPESQK